MPEISIKAETSCEHLKKLIREVPDFPKPGILFYDITTLLKDKVGFANLIDALSEHYLDKFDPPGVCFVCEVDGAFAGTYYVRPNQPGRGGHVANAGYMVGPEFRGRGLAVAMCEHSLETARRLGFTAMQFKKVNAW